MALPLAHLLRIETSVLTGRTVRRALSTNWRPELWAHCHKPSPGQHGIDRPLRSAKTAAAASAAGDGGAVPAPQPPVEEQPCTTAIGQVMAAQANFVRIKVDRLEGSDAAPPMPRLLCVVRALLKKIKREVLVGDHVRVVAIDWTSGRGMVEDVLPRETFLAEPPVANVSHVLLVFSMARPPLQPSSATRYLITAEAAGVPTTVALNKCDLVSDEEAAELQQRVAAWGYRAVPVSVASGEGLQELQETLKGRVTVVAGPSGAGKSSIINALQLKSVGGSDAQGAVAAGLSYNRAGTEAAHGAESDCSSSDTEFSQQVDLPTAESLVVTKGGRGGGGMIGGIDLQAVGVVSDRIGRGRHTTRNVTLVELGEGGLLADTPGFNQPDVVLPPAELAAHFPEIERALAGDARCAFSNCQHLTEPGCVVRGDWERYPLYVELHAELQIIDDEASQRAASKKQREGMVRSKSRAGGVMGMEARLESKAHRRVSRRSVRQKISDLMKDVEDDGDELP